MTPQAIILKKKSMSKTALGSNIFPQASFNAFFIGESNTKLEKKTWRFTAVIKSCYKPSNISHVSGSQGGWNLPHPVPL